MNKLWGIQGQIGSWKKSMRLIGLKGLMGFMGLLGLLGMGFGSCSPEPPLHLYDAQEAMVELSVVDLDFESYWGTVMDLNTNMEIESNWYYGWDAVDVATHGEIGYTLPTVFEVRRYYTGEVPYAKHTAVIRDTIHGNSFQGMYDWGFWDMMLWNEIDAKDGVQSIIIDETTSLDSVFAYTNRTLVRPGEKVRFSAIVRDGKLNAADVKALKVMVYRPDGVLYREATLSNPKTGAFEYEFKFDENAAFGSWQFKVGFDSKKILATSDVTVDAFVPSSIKAKLSASSDRVTAQDTLNVTTRFIYDAPAPEIAVSGKVEETLFSLGRGGCVFYLNSFSKTIAPSMRIGYMILPENMVETYEERLGFYSCPVPLFEQYVLAELLRNGDFERHIRRIRRRRKMTGNELR